MKNIIKIIVTIVIFIYLFKYINIHTLLAVLAKSHGGDIAIALLLQTASTYLAAYRWSDISSLLKFDENRFFYVASYFKGAFFNQVLPSSIGGDAVRVLDLSSKGYHKKEALFDVFIDRVIGLVGLLTLNLISTIIFFGIFKNSFSYLIIAISGGGLLGFIFLFLLHKFHFLENIKGLHYFYKLGIKLDHLYKNKKNLIKHIGISVGVQLLTVMALFAISKSIDIKLDFETFLIAVPPVFLLMIIPLSLAGWGIREGAMVGIFMLVYDDKAKILAMSILYGLLLIISALPGSYFWVKNKTQNSTKADT